jgi:hypothetical protein
MIDSLPNDEKFSAADVADLRGELMQAGLDSWQAAELVSSFLNARGYGLSSEVARSVLTRIDASHCTLECMHRELEQVALVM